jgi:hypothetical protein
MHALQHFFHIVVCKMRKGITLRIILDHMRKEITLRIILDHIFLLLQFHESTVNISHYFTILSYH